MEEREDKAGDELEHPVVVLVSSCDVDEGVRVDVVVVTV